MNATLYTKYDDCLIDALRGIVNKSDSVSGNRVPTRIVVAFSGGGTSVPAQLLPHSETVKNILRVTETHILSRYCQEWE